MCRLKKLEQTMEEMDLPEIEVGRRGIVMLLRSFYREMREEYNMLRRKRSFLRLRRSRLGQDDFKSLKVLYLIILLLYYCISH